MRYLILGAGAIGGAIGGKLAVAGFDVGLVARGAHLEALRSGGLKLSDPDSEEVLHLPAYGSCGEATIEPGDAVLLATKTQQSEAALNDLRRAVGGSKDAPAIFCAQNGVENERIAARRFERVYGVRVVVAATHLEPGEVEVATSPCFGILDIGRYPSGTDDVAAEVASDLRAAGFDARVTDEVMSYKYLKLLGNLANSLEAACGTRLGSELARRIFDQAREEATACYEAAGIKVADGGEDESRRSQLRGPKKPVSGRERRGGSSWQSLKRQTGDIESDYLNGEIALLGRLYGVPTPVNAGLGSLAVELAEQKAPPASMTVEEVGRRLGL